MSADGLLKGLEGGHNRREHPLPGQEISKQHSRYPLCLDQSTIFWDAQKNVPSQDLHQHTSEDKMLK